MVVQSEELPEWPDFTRWLEWLIPGFLVLIAVMVCSARVLGIFYQTHKTNLAGFE